MAKNKRYYWLKLPENIFQDLSFKKIRKLPGGAELTIIYLKMMLLSIKNNGYLIQQNLNDKLETELSLLLDEDETAVLMLLTFLRKENLIIEQEEQFYYLPEAANKIGSESESAIKVRRFRKKQLESKRLHCNQDVTICNQNVTLEKRREDIDSNNNSEEIINNYKNLKYDTPKGDLNNKENIAVVVDALKKIGINEKVATELYAKYEKEVILAALKDMQNRKDILRPGGYLIAMLQKSCPIIDNQTFDLRKTSPKQCEFCKSCKKQYDDNLLCQKNGTRYDYQIGNWVECEYCK